MNSAEVFYHPVKIREGHLDTFGHVNNAVYLELFEEARWEIINQRGFDIESIKKVHLGPVILEVTLKFKIEIKLHQDIRIRTQLKSYEGKIGLLEQVMLNDADEECCTSMFTIALFDTKARRIVTPTPEWLKAVGQT